MARALLDKVELLVLAIPEVLTESGIVSTCTFNGDALEDDFKFERIWNNPYKYIPILAQFDGVIAPDFSLYRDMPLVMQHWNIYRSRAFGHALERAGAQVVAIIRFGDERTYDTSCLRIRTDGIIALGSHGNLKSQTDRHIFVEGAIHVMRKLRPRAVVIYGSAPKEILDYCKQAVIKALVFNSRFAQTHEKRS